LANSDSVPTWESPKEDVVTLATRAILTAVSMLSIAGCAGFRQMCDTPIARTYDAKYETVFAAAVEYCNRPYSPHHTEDIQKGTIETDWTLGGPDDGYPGERREKLHMLITPLPGDSATRLTMTFTWQREPIKIPFIPPTSLSSEKRWDPMRVNESVGMKSYEYVFAQIKKLLEARKQKK
jgi:hypothetical protein